jgi:hypothetical protein
MEKSNQWHGNRQIIQRPPLDYVAEIERLEAQRDVNLRRIALAERVVYAMLGAVALAPAFAGLFIWLAR